jgi:hypothetical protein
MTKKQMAIHNRISTKCHAYVKFTLPEVYAKLVNQAESEYEHGACRRNSYTDIQRALKDKKSEFPTQQGNYWGDIDVPIG